MEKRLKQLMGEFRNVTLSQKEKSLMLQNIQKFIKKNPLVGSLRDGILSGRHDTHSFVYSLWFSPKRLVSGALIVIFLLGGGASLAANTALPGNFLYTIKVNVNEEIQVLLSANAKTKAALQVKRAGERLEEAEKLALYGALDSGKKEKIEKNFDKHTSKVKEQVESFSASGDYKTALNVSSDLEMSLKSHKKVLTNLDYKPANENRVDLILEKVKESINESEQSREIVEIQISTSANEDELKIATEKKLADAIAELASAEENLKSQVSNALTKNDKSLQLDIQSQTVIGGGDIAAMQLMLAEASGMLALGKEKFEVGDFSGAFQLLRKVFDIAVEVNFLMQVNDDFSFIGEIDDIPNIDSADFDDGTVEIQTLSK